MLGSTRRSFLASSLAVATAAGVRSAAAIGPIARNGRPKFKFSLAAYSYRNLLLAKPNVPAQLTLADFINDCARFELDGTELTSYYFLQPTTEAYLQTLARQCFRLGLDVSGTAVGNDFGHPPGMARQEEIAKLKRGIDHAAMLGAPVVRVFAGHAKKGASEAETHRLMVAGLEECCDYAGTQGIHLALENHGGPTSTAAGLLKFVHDVQSPWFGVNLDTGNFHSENVYAELAQVAPYALNVQVKVVTSGPDKVKHPTDYPLLAKMLRDVGYRGYIVLEYEEEGDPREACPLHLAKLREAFTA